MTSLTRDAYAKINLTLDVGARRSDGYHDIYSIMQTISLHDTLTVIQTANVPGVRLEVTGDEGAGIPADESNLVHRAAVRLQKVAVARGIIPGNGSGLHILLHKRIPSRAGLGGGSSDAAATLLVVNDLFGLALSHVRLAEIGAALGADVPFFLTGGTALVGGMGERVSALPPPWRGASLGRQQRRGCGANKGWRMTSKRWSFPAIPKSRRLVRYFIRQTKPTRVSGPCFAAAALASSAEFRLRKRGSVWQAK